MTSPRAAIAEWQNKQITGTELMRRLISFDAWMLPVSEAAAAEMVSTGAASRVMYSQDAQGVSRLYLFSDDAAYDTYSQAVGQEAAAQHFLTTTGAWVFNLPLDTIDAVEIDPATAWQISYRKEQFPRLRAVAGAVDVEHASFPCRAAGCADARNSGVSRQVLRSNLRLDQTRLLRRTSQ